MLVSHCESALYKANINYNDILYTRQTSIIMIYCIHDKRTIIMIYCIHDKRTIIMIYCIHDKRTIIMIYCIHDKRTIEL
jgi:hypothetical protein